eukprot:EC715444.1.p1 GENE.EC715444.1~~EC715444.1.p1  ORF type:complete len:139 (+),score=45.16 EC715444.1:26-442(+)
MADAVTIRTRKFMDNRLLGRKQFVIDVIHPGVPCISKKSLSEKLAKSYKVADPKLVSVFGFKTAFGGGRSSGFGLVYDNLDVVKKIEPRHRLLRVDMAKKPEMNRKQKKEREARKLRSFGTKKRSDYRAARRQAKESK